jgi:hypothetical protein
MARCTPRALVGSQGGARQGMTGGDAPRRRRDDEAGRRLRTAVFNGGGVAPVALDECGGVLQLEGDQWREGGGRLRNGAARRALIGRGRTAVMLEQSPTRRRGSDGGKLARRTPGRWGMNMRRSGVDG